MLNFQTIYTAGIHKVTALREDAKRRNTSAQTTEDARSHRTSTLLWTLRLLAS